MIFMLDVKLHTSHMLFWSHYIQFHRQTFTFPVTSGSKATGVKQLEGSESCAEFLGSAGFTHGVKEKREMQVL